MLKVKVHKSTHGTDQRSRFSTVHILQIKGQSSVQYTQYRSKLKVQCSTHGTSQRSRFSRVHSTGQRSRFSTVHTVQIKGQGSVQYTQYKSKVKVQYSTHGTGQRSSFSTVQYRSKLIVWPQRIALMKGAVQIALSFCCNNTQHIIMIIMDNVAPVDATST